MRRAPPTPTGLPATPAHAPAWAQPLADDFDGPDFAPGGGLYYKLNAEQAAGTRRFAPGTGPAGRGTLHLAVHPRCAPGDPACSERAEVWERPAVLAPYGTPMWYGFALALDAPIPDDDHRYLLAQWKRQILPGAAGDISPFLALRLRRGRLYLTVETALLPTVDTASAGAAPVQVRRHDHQMRALVAAEPGTPAATFADYARHSEDIRVIPRGAPLPAAGSGWIDFALRVQPGPDGDGHIEVLANGAWVATVRGHIGHAGPGLGPMQYFKFGPYRAGHPGAWRVRYARFRRGPRALDVLPAAHCPPQLRD